PAAILLEESHPERSCLTGTWPRPGAAGTDFPHEPSERGPGRGSRATRDPLPPSSRDVKIPGRFIRSRHIAIHPARATRSRGASERAASRARDAATAGELGRDAGEVVVREVGDLDRAGAA